MKIITRRQKNASVAERWKEQYLKSSGFDSIVLRNGKTKKQVYEELIALKNPTKEEIDNIIGNPSWTCIVDTETGKAVDVAIEIDTGEEFVYLGEATLRKALDLIEEAKAKGI